MRIMFAVILFASVSFLFTLETVCQDFSKLREKAKEDVRSKRPSWKLINKDEGDKQVVYTWGSVQEGIGILIFYGTSMEEASERMQLGIKFLSVGPGKKRKNFGDEAYSWESSRGNFAGIRFRKSHVYIEVTAPSLALAEDIARSLAKEIRRK